jgi:hypothetical protein
VAAPCFLCGRAPDITNAFVPEASVARRLGQPEGKQRVIIYGVCERCMDNREQAEIMELMEQKLNEKRPQGIISCGFCICAFRVSQSTTDHTSVFACDRHIQIKA